MKTNIKVGAICFILGAAIMLIIIGQIKPFERLVVDYVEKDATEWKTKYLQLLYKPADEPLTSEECKLALECTQSPLDATHEVKEDTLYITVFDKCKKVRFGYKVRSEYYRKHFIQGKIGYTFENTIAGSVGYLRAVNKYFAVGPELYIGKKDQGIFAIAQLSL